MKKTLRYGLDARARYGDLFARVRDRSAGDYARVTECVARELLGTIKGVVAHVEGHVDALVVELVPPDNMRGLGLPLLEALQAAARRDPEMQRSPLGRVVRLRFQRSEPAPEPEPEPERTPEPVAALPVVAATPVDVTRTFDAAVEVAAFFAWLHLRGGLAQHPELVEPICTIEAPRGMDPGLFLEAVARQGFGDPLPLGFKKLTLHTSPAVA